MASRLVWVALATSFLDRVAHTMLVPVFPRLVTGDAAWYGVVKTLTGLASLLSATLYGRASDVYGRKPLMLVGHTLSVLSFVLLVTQQPVQVAVVIAKVLGGARATFAIARAVMADASGSEARSRTIGRIGTAMGLGYIVGPFCAGFFSQFGLHVPPMIAAGVGAANWLLVYFLLPATTAPAAVARKASTARLSLWEQIRRTLAMPTCLNLLLVRLALSFAFFNFTTTFVMFTQARVGFGTREHSYLLAYLGSLYAVVPLIMPRVAACMGERRLLLASVLSLFTARFLFASAADVRTVVVAVTCVGFGGGVSNVLLPSLLTKAAPANEAGYILGLATSTHGLASFVAPYVSGQLFQRLGPSAPAAVSGVVTAVAFLVAVLGVQEADIGAAVAPNKEETVETVETKKKK